MDFKIERNPYVADKPLFDSETVSIEPGLTVLIGCNGSGKSTLLGQIGTQVREYGFSCISYDDEHQGGTESFAKATYRGDLGLASAILSSSEGEKIYLNIGEVAHEIGIADTARRIEGKPLFILIDGLDSGLDIPTIKEVKTELFDVIMGHAGDLDTYIIVTANSYALAQGESCLDITTGTYKSFTGYESHEAFVTESVGRKSRR